ncbi:MULTISPECIES: hypothetical protein [Pseudomonas]|uniref:Uncharacterized protein n=1 Tax=Pseudomonas kilonensis TaxID=132476 RepID=A0ABY0ZFZ3_9PSED|nr:MULTISPECIES: hypothetical protein [Pseudomonas]SEE61174.1 hypothetical protein SAMN04490188_4698 [Pseudomonas kilonensis]
MRRALRSTHSHRTKRSTIEHIVDRLNLSPPWRWNYYWRAIGAGLGVGLNWYLIDKLLSESEPDAEEKKKTIAGLSGKNGAKDIPNWAKGERSFKGESGKDFADRLLGKKYGDNGYNKGPASEHNKIRKWGDRAFE